MADQIVTIRISADGKAAVTGIGAVESKLGGLGKAGKTGGRAAASGIDAATRATKALGTASTTVARKTTLSHREIAAGIGSISTQLARVQKLYAGWIASTQVEYRTDKRPVPR